MNKTKSISTSDSLREEKATDTSYSTSSCATTKGENVSQLTGKSVSYGKSWTVTSSEEDESNSCRCVSSNNAESHTHSTGKNESYGKSWTETYTENKSTEY